MVAFAGWHGLYGSLGGDPAYLTSSDYSSADDTVFAETGGFAEILEPGFYQVAAYAQINLASAFTPSSDLDTWLYLWLFDDTDDEVGQSIEASNARTANNWVIFPAGVNEHRWLQRIMPVSLTDAADFPVTIKPEITRDDDTNLKVQVSAVWGYRLGGPLAASLSD